MPRPPARARTGRLGVRGGRGDEGAEFEPVSVIHGRVQRMPGAPPFRGDRVHLARCPAHGIAKTTSAPDGTAVVTMRVSNVASSASLDAARCSR